MGGLRLSKTSVTSAIAGNTESDGSSQPPVVLPEPVIAAQHHARQFHIDTRFPQRRNPAKDSARPAIRPNSADKLISGIWRQLHSPIKLTLPLPVCFDMHEAWEAHN